MMRAAHIGDRQSGGSILILTLWTLFFLGALAVAVGGRVAGNLNAAAMLRDRAAGYYAARAGAEQAVMALLADTNSWDAADAEWADNEELFRNVAIADAAFSVQYTVTDSSGETTIRYGLQAETGRININKANSNLLVAIIATAADMDREEAAGIVDGMREYRARAAEDQLTEGNQSGYDGGSDSSSAVFSSVYELTGVTGVDEALFIKLEPYLTVHGKGRVNINTAEKDVLRALALSVTSEGNGAIESLPAKLLAFREQGGVFSGRSVSAIRKELEAVVELEPDEVGVLGRMLRYASVESTVFRGTSYGWSSRQDVSTGTGGSRVADAEIEFVYDRDARSFVMWYEI